MLINIPIPMEPLRAMMMSACALLWAASDGPAQVAQPTPAVARLSGDTFTNPLLETGPDPWVIWWKGFYYYTDTSGKNLTLRKTADITDLRSAEKKEVWTPELGQPWSNDLWAPELHRWGNKWYIYFAADAGDNASHRIYVVENNNDDPLEGNCTFKGKISDSSDKWAIDPTTFELNNEHYLVWSGWKGNNDGEQDLFIAHMSNPWTIDSPRTLISKPTYPWEEHGDLPGRHVNVNEGPEFISHGNRMFIVFSASIRRAGPRSTTHSLVRIRVPLPLAQDITASSSLLTDRKTGLFIMPIRSRKTVATIFAHRVSSASPGIPTAGRTSVLRRLLVSR
jgi:hypothetical protein